MKQTVEDTKEYTGIWVTADGHVRHELYCLMAGTTKPVVDVKVLTREVTG